MAKFEKYLIEKTLSEATMSMTQMIEKINDFDKNIWAEELPKYKGNMELWEVISDIFHFVIKGKSDEE